MIFVPDKNQLTAAEATSGSDLAWALPQSSGSARVEFLSCS